MEHQTTKLEQILKLLQIIARTKTNVSNERWNGRVEFHGKNDQPRKNLDNLTIYFFLNRISWAIQ